MNLWKIALRSVQHRRLASGLTALSIGLGVALVVGVMVIHGVVSHTFRRSGEGYDLIVGAKGSRLEMVLNTVYHIGKPVGTVPYEYYKEFESGRFAGDVELAVPCCMGGNYKGFRVVGTTPDMFDEIPFPSRRIDNDLSELATDEEREEARRREQDKFADSKGLFSEGENFGWGDYFGGVVGATVARKTGLKVGDKFRPVHGFDAEQGEEHDEFEVVGVLRPTGTANDRALFINIEGFWQIHEHGHYDESLDVLPGENASAEKPDSADHADANVVPGHDEAEHDHAAKEEEPDHQADDGHDHADEAGAGHNHPHDGEDGPDHAENGGDDEADHEHGAGDGHNHAFEGEAGHDHDHDHGHDHGRQVTAILVRTNEKQIARAMALPKIINQEGDAQAAMPAEEVTRLLEGIVGNIQAVLLVFAVMIVIVAGIGMMVSIYNSMSERRHEIAVMRALGARRTTVMSIILLESILLSLGGGIIGLVLGHSLIGLLAPQIMEHTGVVVHALQFQAAELILIPGLVFMASIVGYLPAVIAYRTEVAESLSE
ncbi:MAG: FtsX-like permease family protein [Planctomycetaceae bacterium]|nr:FtsX-like permease family protein [Planctomycetaceae bacterium]